MNIDVTVVGPDNHVWSEKFAEVVCVNSSQDDGITIVGDNEVLSLDPGAGTRYGEPMILAEYARGSWHSWRRTS